MAFFTPPESDTKNDVEASGFAAGLTSDNGAPTTPAAFDTGCKVDDDDDEAGRANGTIADVARDAVDVEFRPSISCFAISKLPLKRRAFALASSPGIDPVWPQVRALSLSVNVPEAGHWGVSAQEILLARQETPSAAKRRVKANRRQEYPRPVRWKSTRADVQSRKVHVESYRLYGSRQLRQD